MGCQWRSGRQRSDFDGVVNIVTGWRQWQTSASQGRLLLLLLLRRLRMWWWDGIVSLRRNVDKGGPHKRRRVVSG